MTHFLYVPFTGLGLKGGYRGDAWLKNRILIFKSFVYPSLLQQTNRDFILWISWRPEDRNNPIVQELFEFLNLRAIFTYHGVCFWDDKYPDWQARAHLKESLEQTLPELRNLIKGDYVYMTIQPSDDMYLPDVVENIQKFQPGNFNHRACGYMHGYMINYATKEIAEYNPDTIPPFFTIRFPVTEFLDPEKHIAWAPYKSHEYIDKIGFSGYFERKFIVGTHGENISTTWEHPYKGRLLEEWEQKKILAQTGIYYTDPVIIRQGMRHLARKVFNKLPFNKQLRELYRKLPTKWQRI